MKFTKRYRAFVKEQEEELPVVQLKKLKSVLKNCEVKNLISKDRNQQDFHCHQDCPECDGAFFPSLLKDMSAIVDFFNKRSKKLLDYHLASGFQKCIMFLGNKMQGRHVNLIKNGNDLVTYATVNAVAIQKILKKYDKVHCSMKGQRFRLEAQSKHLDLLKSPWLFELMAFHINLRGNKEQSSTFEALFDCILHVDDERPLFLVTLFNSIRLNLELICPICLETVFDPVSLPCSHIFCYMCACSVANVSIVDGLEAADPNKSKCPICRKDGAFEGAVHLDELNILLNRSLPEYWEQRLKRERRERIKQTKEHWEHQCRVFMGYN